MAPKSLESLQSTWRTLYSSTLPNLARAKDPAQPKWPVVLDHCFARIILDNTVGKSATSDRADTQWDKVIGKPAVKNMSEDQLIDAIELGEKIRTGEVDLVELDEASLKARGKNSKVKTKMDGKRKAENTKSDTTRSPKKRKHDDGKTQSTLSFSQSQDAKRQTQPQSDDEHEPRQLPSPAPESDSNGNKKETAEEERKFPKNPTPEFFRATLKRIKESDITPFRKRLYTILLSVPRGEYTTYAAMATYLNSAARAVGNGMRNNPFAPDVPCHRVLASDGTIGGFMGSWTKKGETQDDNIRRKIDMLKEEGVRFDSAGKVKGPVWKGFKDLDAFEKELGEVK